MKILYISYDGVTDPLGQSQVIPYLNGLSSLGYEITLISFEKPKRYALSAEKIKRLLHDNHISWKPLRYTKYPPVLSSFYDLVRGFLMITHFIFFHHPALVHCRGHYLTSLMALLPMKISKTKYVFDMRGFWADERVEGGLWNTEKIIYRVLYKAFKRLEKHLIEYADQVITLTHAAKKYIGQNFSVKREIIVIPCAADLSHFNYAGNQVRDAVRNKFSVTDKFVLVYLGSIGTWYMLNEMLDFFKVLKEEIPNAFFLLITHDAAFKILEVAEKKGIKNSEIKIMEAERKEVPELLSASDAAIFFITPVFSKLGSSPTKHGEMLGCGLPLICNGNVGDMEEIVAKTKSGVIIQRFDEAAYQQGAKELLQMKALARSHFREAAFAWYSLEDGVKKYAEIYGKLTASNP